jgi:WD40 repeat protein
MVMNASKNKLVSTGLDGKIYVWNITRGHNGIVESINSEKILTNDQVICSLNCSLLRPSLIVTGTMDGKIKFWDINSGEVEKVLVVNDGPIV